MQVEVLATGLTGLVGSRVRELLHINHRWTNFDTEKYESITNQDMVNRFVGENAGSVLIHFAAFTDVNAAWRQKGDRSGTCYSINVNGSENVALACRKHDKYLIHVSTEYVFSGENAAAYTEEDRPEPIEWYGQTKYWSEQAIQASGCSYVIIRPAFPFRSHFDRKVDVVRRVVKQLQEGNMPPMFSDSLITPTLIDDIALAIERIIDLRPGGIFHVTGSTSLSPYELAKKVADTFGFEHSAITRGSLTAYLSSSQRPYHRYLNISNAKSQEQLRTKLQTIDEALRELRNQMTL